MFTRLNNFLLNDLIKYRNNQMKLDRVKERLEEVEKIIQTNYMFDFMVEDDYKMCTQLIETYTTFYNIETTYKNTL